MSQWKLYSCTVRTIWCHDGKRIRCSSYTHQEVNCKSAARHYARLDAGKNDEITKIIVTLVRPKMKQRGGSQLARSWRRMMKDALKKMERKHPELLVDLLKMR